MSDCCRFASTSKAPCPRCGQPGLAVTTTTLLTQLRQPWNYPGRDQQHWFCSQRDCTLVYFSDSGQQLEQSQLRQAIGQKSGLPQRTLCYCYNISAEQADQDPSLKQFVIEQTTAKACACESRNPSGRCCLKDFG